jgi:hypothetical protein
MLQKLLALVIVLLLPVPALAGTHTLKFSCRYTKYFDKEGAHPTDFRLSFILDLDTGTAYMLSRTGRTRVQAGGWPDSHTWTKGVAFFEFTPSGHLRTTTSIEGGHSVHTRWALVAGEWVATQYSGPCVGAVTGKAPDWSPMRPCASGARRKKVELLTYSGRLRRSGTVGSIHSNGACRSAGGLYTAVRPAKALRAAGQ